jgi:hypothetical protein
MESVDELVGFQAAVISVTHPLGIGHYAALLDITDDQVSVADPIYGFRVLSWEEFEGIWRHDTVVLWRGEH